MLKKIGRQNVQDYRKNLYLDLLFGDRANGTVSDESETAMSFSNTGTPARVYDEALGAYVMELQGTDKVSCSDQAPLRTVPFTVLCLVKWNQLPSALGEWTDFIVKKCTGLAVMQWGLTANNATDQLSAQIAKIDGSFSEAIAEKSLVADEWYFVAFTVDDAYVGTLYIDGVAEADQAIAGEMIANPSDFCVGDPGYAGTGIDNRVCALRFYSELLTAEKMEAVFEVWRRRFGFQKKEKAPLTDSFSDRFSDGILDDVKWNNWGGAQVVVSGNRLEITTTLLAVYDGVRYPDPLNMEESFVSVELVDAGNQALATYECDLDARLDDSNFVYFSISGGNVSYASIVGGAYTWRAGMVYDPAKHKFFRIRESGGNTYAEWSTDGKTWVTLFSHADYFAMDAIEAVLRAGCWGVEASTTTAVFDNFNLIP